MVDPPKVINPSTNRTRCSFTSLMWPKLLPLRQTSSRVTAPYKLQHYCCCADCQSRFCLRISTAILSLVHFTQCASNLVDRLSLNTYCRTQVYRHHVSMGFFALGDMTTFTLLFGGWRRHLVRRVAWQCFIVNSANCFFCRTENIGIEFLKDLSLGLREGALQLRRHAVLNPLQSVYPIAQIPSFTTLHVV